MRGNVIYAGVDYKAILRAAEQDPGGCDLIIWDGGNNDFPFYRPDLMVTVTDPHRAGDELAYYPGETTLRIADVVVINKIDSADGKDIQTVRENIYSLNPRAVVIDAASPIRVDDPSLISGKRVLVVEDGPTLTHGQMKFGAGIVAAQRYGAGEIVDPRPYTVGRISETFRIYPYIGTLLPAMGYGEEQLKDLETTINTVECDSVIIGTPIDLSRIIKIKKPTTRVFYELQEIGKPNMEDILDDFIKDRKLK
jgi:predicted GTPase